MYSLKTAKCHVGVRGHKKKHLVSFINLLVFSRHLKGADDQLIDYGPEVPQAWQSKFDFQYESNESQHQTNSENFLNL